MIDHMLFDRLSYYPFTQNTHEITVNGKTFKNVPKYLIALHDKTYLENAYGGGGTWVNKGNRINNVIYESKNYWFTWDPEVEITSARIKKIDVQAYY